MIGNLKHKGLKLFYEKGQAAGLNPKWLKRIRLILARLDVASEPSDLDLPGLRLHPLKGKLKGFYAVDVSENWRIVFRFDNGEICDVDLCDYH